MKNMFMKLVLLFATACMVISCSTNTTKENTIAGAATGAVAGGLLGSLATGAGAGWVIAAGAVGGAIIGGLIGNSMDSTDKTHINNSLSNNPRNKATHWTNKHGASYTMVPTSKRFTYNGNKNCRRFKAVSTMNGKTMHTHGIACMQADGSWDTVK